MFPIRHERLIPKLRNESSKECHLLKSFRFTLHIPIPLFCTVEKPKRTRRKLLLLALRQTTLSAKLKKPE